MDNIHFKFNLFICGYKNAGKTTMIKYITNNKNNNDTKDVNFNIHYYKYNNHLIKINIWDFTSIKENISLIKGYLDRIDYIILLIDVSNIDTFINIKFWANYFNTNYKNKNIILVGNQTLNFRQITTKECLEFSNKLGYEYYEVGYNKLWDFNIPFHNLIYSIYNQKNRNNIIKKRKTCRLCLIS